MTTYRIRPIRWEDRGTYLNGFTFLGLTYKVSKERSSWFTAIGIVELSGSGYADSFEDAMQQCEQHWQLRIQAGLLPVKKG